METETIEAREQIETQFFGVPGNCMTNTHPSSFKSEGLTGFIFVIFGVLDSSAAIPPAELSVPNVGMAAGRTNLS